MKGEEGWRCKVKLSQNLDLKKQYEKKFVFKHYSTALFIKQMTLSDSESYCKLGASVVSASFFRCF